MIQPIETTYSGYRFRSRLEARHAVLFDHLEEPWEYEREGFNLPSGRYLPDFWLPRLRAWVEVKGQEPSHREQNSIIELQVATGCLAILSVGIPTNDPPSLRAYLFDIGDSSGGIGWWDLKWGWEIGKIREGLAFLPDHWYSDRGFFIPNEGGCGPELTFTWGDKSIDIIDDDLYVARSARFEFSR